MRAIQLVAPFAILLTVAQVQSYSSAVPLSELVGQVAGDSVSAPTNSLTTVDFLQVLSSGKPIDVKKLGAKGDGAADDSAAIQSAINAVPDAGGAVYLPCGTFVIGATIAFRGNTRIYGDGPCTIIKESARMAPYAPFSVRWPSIRAAPLVTNANYASGNSNIAIDHIAFDMTNATCCGVASHAILCYKCSNVRVDAISVNGDNRHAQDGTAFVQSTNYQVTNSRVTNVTNACYDQWQSSSHFSITDNYCAGGGHLTYGILTTGADTTGGAGTTSHGVVARNTIYNVTNNAIWIQGGSVGSTTDIEVTGNTIDTVTAFTGIRASEATRIRITGNVIRNTFYQCFGTNGERPAGGATDVVFAGNTCSNVEKSNSAKPIDGAGILVGNGTKNSSFTNNRIEGAYTYPIVFMAGSSGNVFAGNAAAPGRLGAYLDNGANNTVKLSAGR